MSPTCIKRRAPLITQPTNLTGHLFVCLLLVVPIIVENRELADEVPGCTAQQSQDCSSRHLIALIDSDMSEMLQLSE